jgi:hypothetical protein
MNRRSAPFMHLIAIDDWHEDFGDVLLYRVPVREPPVVGSPLDTFYEEGYYTHFTFLPQLFDEEASPKGALDVQ